ncbi:MAG: hypothetical protein JWN69_963, partial [Alphaproteobacteria bacterium]|nr:hypothetical protein [Alphaproteobacteria bacterium]
MAYPVALPAMAALSIVGAALGVHLGRSAIAEINPAYFSTPEPTHFFADLAPNVYRATTWSDSTDYWANDVNVGGGAACLDCNRNFIDGDSADAALPDWRDTPSADAADERDDEPDDSADPDRAARAEQVARYASFPVSVDEAREQALDDYLARHAAEIAAIVVEP